MKIRINGKIIKTSKSIKLLGVIFQQNNKFFNHIRNRLEGAQRAKFGLARLLRSRFIEQKIKLNIYKTFIRPVLTYACPIWLRPNNISSCFIEKVRIFERKILRTAGNIHRRRGTFKYCDNATLYQRTNITRIGRYAGDLALSFFDKCKTHIRTSINGLVPE